MENWTVFWPKTFSSSSYRWFSVERRRRDMDCGANVDIEARFHVHLPAFLAGYNRLQHRLRLAQTSFGYRPGRQTFGLAFVTLRVAQGNGSQSAVRWQGFFFCRSKRPALRVRFALTKRPPPTLDFTPVVCRMPSRFTGSVSIFSSASTLCPSKACRTLSSSTSLGQTCCSKHLHMSQALKGF